MTEQVPGGYWRSAEDALRESFKTPPDLEEFRFKREREIGRAGVYAMLHVGEGLHRIAAALEHAFRDGTTTTAPEEPPPKRPSK